MDRRRFVRTLGTGAIGAAAMAPQAAHSIESASKTPTNVRMRLGTQRQSRGEHGDPLPDELLQFFARHGVEGFCGFPTITEDRRWDLDEIRRMQDKSDAAGVKLEILGGPLANGSLYGPFPHILLGKDPERDREIELFCDMIGVAARAGVPCVKYNLSILKVLRTEPTPGRGGSQYSTWVYAKAPKLPLTAAGEVPGELFWERITYFLERVVPVATEHKVRLACHPHDPGVPPQGYQGIDRVLGTVEGLKRFIEIATSPYHGLNFCIGSVAEMLHDPANEIADVVRYFGERDKLFMIHFRNIRGRRDDFQEVYPDNGDLDMVELMRVLKEVDYPHLVMPDHMPQHPNDSNGRQAFAYGYGYIKALIQVVSSEA
ncbi:MAG: mannonate dehydratase [Planctomycetaceae bacterium]